MFVLSHRCELRPGYGNDCDGPQPVTALIHDLFKFRKFGIPAAYLQLCQILHIGW